MALEPILNPVIQGPKTMIYGFSGNILDVNSSGQLTIVGNGGAGVAVSQSTTPYGTVLPNNAFVVGLTDGFDYFLGGDASFPLRVDPSGTTVQPVSVTGTVTVKETGAPTIASGQVALSTSSTQVVATRATRISIKITNLSAIAVYVGATGVTTATGDLLSGFGSFVSLPTTAAIFAVAASGTPSVSFIEVYG